MKARTKLLTIPEGSSRYWMVDHPERGPHHFKHPYFGVAASVFVYLSGFRVDPETDTRPDQLKNAEMLPVAGAVLGACWWHRGLELETPLPIGNLSPESLTAYGHAVAEELQDADYSMLDIIDLFGTVLPELTRRQSLLVMAEQRTAFIAPPQVNSTSN